MKQFVFIAFVVVATIAASNAAEKYTSRFDNVNVDQILSNDRILNSYIKCLLEKGPCTQEGRELKSKLKTCWFYASSFTFFSLKISIF